jgi:hypothetical protein
MDVANLEGIAIALYKRLGLDPSEPVSPVRLARTWLGADAIGRGHVIGGMGSSGRVNGRWRILVRPTLPVPELVFTVGHELGHVLLAEEGWTGDRDEEERAADLIAGALLAPQPAMRKLYRAHGLDLAAIAETVNASQTWAALRVGEAVGEPIAAISPALVRVRGPESFVWPSEPEIRKFARGRAARPGLAKVRITDAPGRVALVGDEDASETG